MSKKSENTPQQDKYKKIASVMEQIQKQMNAAALKAGQDEIAKLLEENPELAAQQFHFVPTNRCLPKAKIPFSSVYLKIIDALLLNDGINKTQKAVNELVEEKYLKEEEGKISPNVWTKPLEPWMVKQIIARVNGNMVKPVDVSKCNTLGEIKNKLKVSQFDGGAVFKYTGKVIINKHTVMVGKASYPLMKRGASYSIQLPIPWDDGGKRQWIRVDALMAFLKNLKEERIAPATLDGE